MKLTPVALAVSALVAGGAARNCTPDLYYCGYNLLKIGNYQPQMDQHSFDRGLGTEFPYRWNQAIFSCRGGRSGDIEWRMDCPNGCVDGGSGNNDYCSSSFAKVVKPESTEKTEK